MSPTETKISHPRSGWSPFDAMVALGITAALIAAGVMGISRRDAGTVKATRQDLAEDLRRARLQATLDGARMRFEAHGERYVITQLRDADGNGIWERDVTTAPRRVDLPRGISVNAFSGGASAVAEFDGRGLLVPDGDGTADGVAVTVTDHDGRIELLQISPSGNIDEVASIS